MQDSQYIEALVKKGARICKVLRTISPESNWREIVSIFNSYKINVKKDKSDMDDLSCLDEVWNRVKTIHLNNQNTM